ncbi:hypothetical protein [Geodermatophilus sabuli]|uniref:Uncharacterized protein n=1 Tax=Geodermatophilus sabuli TaxID=1564158 RepID=A0A285EA17_9ACTN|nr:hypothetical protein [Geodermatophilus sabuli]MBB3084782.1 hypothetical protein [Geodermatophilus sabuli]SNX95810.1 hypothetical protein SAMN06893097_102514 [Geodermatophilus sabuli]
MVGSGIATQWLSPDDVDLQLLENALITGAVLATFALLLVISGVVRSGRR